MGTDLHIYNNTYIVHKINKNDITYGPNDGSHIRANFD